jgi:hypothetical protein
MRKLIYGQMSEINTHQKQFDDKSIFMPTSLVRFAVRATLVDCLSSPREMFIFR